MTTTQVFITSNQMISPEKALADLAWKIQCDPRPLRVATLAPAQAGGAVFKVMAVCDVMAA